MFDFIFICLSKGLGVFVGLFLFGEKVFIKWVCCICKVMGGGMC